MYTLKITLSIIVVFKYQKQPAKKVPESNYTKNKLIYVYISVYTSKRDPAFGFLMYNPGKNILLIKKGTHTYFHIIVIPQSIA